MADNITSEPTDREIIRTELDHRIEKNFRHGSYDLSGIIDTGLAKGLGLSVKTVRSVIAEYKKEAKTPAFKLARDIAKRERLEQAEFEEKRSLFIKNYTDDAEVRAIADWDSFQVRGSLSPNACNPTGPGNWAYAVEALDRGQCVNKIWWPDNFFLMKIYQKPHPDANYSDHRWPNTICLCKDRAYGLKVEEYRPTRSERASKIWLIMPIIKDD